MILHSIKIWHGKLAFHSRRLAVLEPIGQQMQYLPQSRNVNMKWRKEERSVTRMQRPFYE